MTDEKEYRDLTDDELDRILTDHWRWLYTDKKEGAQGDLRKCVLVGGRLKDAWDRLHQTGKITSEQLDHLKTQIRRQYPLIEAINQYFFVTNCGRDAVLFGVHLDGAKLEDAHLERAYLCAAHLDGADLSFARLGGAFLIDADLKGAKLEDAHLEGAFLIDADLKGAKLHDAHLEGAVLMGAHLDGADLSFAHLDGSDLGEAHLERTDLSFAHLDGAILIAADLKGAKLEDAHLDRAKLQSAHLEVADLRGAHLKGANLMDARLDWAFLFAAHIEVADLRGAHLKGAVLRESHIDGADFRKANIGGSDLRGTDFKGVKLSGILYDKTENYAGVRVTECFGGEGFVRYANDQAWLADYKSSRKGFGQNAVAWLWKITSDYGRSISRWTLVSLILAIVFACLYTPLPDCVTYWIPGFKPYAHWLNMYWPQLIDNTAPPGEPVYIWSSLYFSIVTFTTLGFGDIVAATFTARILVTLEVIVGYIMLGGLISIFANKFARRS